MFVYARSTEHEYREPCRTVIGRSGRAVPPQRRARLGPPAGVRSHQVGQRELFDGTRPAQDDERLLRRADEPDVTHGTGVRRLELDHVTGFDLVDPGERLLRHTLGPVPA